MYHSVHTLTTRSLQYAACFLLMMALAAGMAAQDDCPYDLNGDGCTCANELLFFLSAWGVAGNTDYDFNDNGFRDFEDALIDGVVELGRWVLVIDSLDNLGLLTL